MSGRKYSLMVLNAAIHEAIECRIGLASACDATESLARALADAAPRTKDMQALRDSGTDLLRRVREGLEAFSARCDGKRLSRLRWEEVTDMRHSMEGLRRELDALSDRCRKAGKASETRAPLAAIRTHLQEKRDDLEPWLPRRYPALLGEVDALLQQIDRCIGNDDSIDRLSDRVETVVADYRSALEAAVAARRKHGERQYVAESLSRVCGNLGFGVTTLPGAGPLDDLVLEVDTYAYGLLHFRLELEGTIRSQSEMISLSCHTNFAQIEDGLKGLGVVTDFRYEGDQSPVRLKKGTRPLPGTVTDNRKSASQSG